MTLTSPSPLAEGTAPSSGAQPNRGGPGRFLSAWAFGQKTVSNWLEEMTKSSELLAPPDSTHVITARHTPGLLLSVARRFQSPSGDGLVNQAGRDYKTLTRLRTIPMATLASPPDPDSLVLDPDIAAFARYKQASISHQSLQMARWKLREATAETVSQRQASEAALARSSHELDLARDGYLRLLPPRPAVTNIIANLECGFR
jgi:hypothetical protein